MLTKIDKMIVYCFLEDKEFYSIDIEDKKGQYNRLNDFNAAMRTNGWGQRTMNCITDAYTNYGWASVAAWVVTGFQPGVGVAIAGVCAYQYYQPKIIIK